MGIIRRVGEAITGVGERTERAGQSMLSSLGYRSRSHALRSRIESLKVPQLAARKQKAKPRTRDGTVVSTRRARAAAYQKSTSSDTASGNANTTEIVFRGG
ncbi:MAG: hypothetical protein QGG54_14040 [Gammaproteobacteria bacterium]|nr:hypothetical protein [Gammaproteobacteria bacterium]|tara:strand:+ start:825 stop:1127 length:303 start_codon:yes stop_codon:yes gene_type:complete